VKTDLARRRINTRSTDDHTVVVSRAAASPGAAFGIAPLVVAEQIIPSIDVNSRQAIANDAIKEGALPLHFRVVRLAADHIQDASQLALGKNAMAPVDAIDYGARRVDVVPLDATSARCLFERVAKRSVANVVAKASNLHEQDVLVGDQAFLRLDAATHVAHVAFTALGSVVPLWLVFVLPLFHLKTMATSLLSGLLLSGLLAKLLLKVKSPCACKIGCPDGMLIARMVFVMERIHASSELADVGESQELGRLEKGLQRTRELDRSVDGVVMKNAAAVADDDRPS